MAPVLGTRWDIGVLVGPHTAPEFLTRAGLEALLRTTWEVHFNSARTGVRLIGPRPDWARADGGDAGLHPSNIHDTGYAIGAVDLTGDMPIILGPDGPSLGGFVCPAVVAAAERWKLGQLRPGTGCGWCRGRRRGRRARRPPAHDWIDRATTPIEPVARPGLEPATAHRDGRRSTTRSWRRREPDGDHPERDLPPGRRPVPARRVRPDDARPRRCGCGSTPSTGGWPAPVPAGVVDATAGVRSLLVQVDGEVLTRGPARWHWCAPPRTTSVDIEHTPFPSRVVHLPLSWDDPSTREAIERYMHGVRADAPWCPWNIEFIRRINGLASTDDVRRIVFDASYLVLGLGDVYLGAPVATPLDPRHRLVTTKYNPARTWTPENAVGIGGAYLCIYGMEGPGGYQFVGRTVQVWNREQRGPHFERTLAAADVRPAPLVHPVTAEELLGHAGRAAGWHARHPMEETTFRWPSTSASSPTTPTEIDAFRAAAAPRLRRRAAGVGRRR